MKKKIAFIVRGNLKQPDKFRANITKHFQNEFEVYLRFTRRIGHAIDIVDELLEVNKVDYVIGVGGDGTFSEVINGYMKAPEEIRNNVTLAAFPRGAGNDFSRSAGIVKSMEHLYAVIKKGDIQKLDLVEASYKHNGKNITRYYDNSFDIGLGGLVCQFVNKSGKTFGSNFTYLTNILRSFFNFKRIPLKIESNGFNFQGNVLIAVFNNGKFFGSGLNIVPDAVLDDGKINVLVARKINILQFLWHIPKLKRGTRINHPEIFYGELSECHISSEKENCPMEFDGEVVGKLPINLKVIKHAATLIRVT